MALDQGLMTINIKYIFERMNPSAQLWQTNLLNDKDIPFPYFPLQEVPILLHQSPQKLGGIVSLYLPTRR